MLRRALSMVLLLCCFFLINSCAYSAINKDGYGFFRTGDMLNTRIYSQAVLLKDGRVFIAGGKIGDPKKNLSFWRTTDTTEIYDPKTEFDILSGIKLSDENLDLIDFKMKKMFIKV